MFAFSFESHGRCETPKRFNVKLEKRNAVGVRFNKNTGYLGFCHFEAEIYDGWVMNHCEVILFGNEQSYPRCFSRVTYCLEDIEPTTLVGDKDRWGCYTCARLMALHF